MCAADQAMVPPFFVLGVGMPFVGETVYSILAAQIPLAVLAVMVKGDLLPEVGGTREAERPVQPPRTQAA